MGEGGRLASIVLLAFIFTVALMLNTGLLLLLLVLLDRLLLL